MSNTCVPALSVCRIPWIAGGQLQLCSRHASHTGLMAPAPLGALLPAMQHWCAAAHSGVPCQQWNCAECSSMPRRGASNQPSVQHAAMQSCALEGEGHKGLSASQVCCHKSELVQASATPAACVCRLANMVAAIPPAAVAPCRVLLSAAQGTALQQTACAQCCPGEA